jgi:hypothetical protein
MRRPTPHHPHSGNACPTCEHSYGSGGGPHRVKIAKRKYVDRVGVDLPIDDRPPSCLRGSRRIGAGNRGRFMPRALGRPRARPR